MARLTKTSQISGITRTLEFTAYSQEEFDRLYYAYITEGLLEEDAFPKLSNKALLFIKYGCTSEEWDKSMLPYGE